MDEHPTPITFANGEQIMLTVEEFGAQVGINRQTVSHHLRKGLLRQWVVEGRILVDPYQIPSDLVAWFRAQPGIKRAPTSDDSALRLAAMRDNLEDVRIQLALTKSELSATHKRIEDKEAIIDSLRAELARADETIATLKDAIAAHQTANEALNNERAVINQKLQKYREPEPPAAKPGLFASLLEAMRIR